MHAGCVPSKRCQFFVQWLRPIQFKLIFKEAWWLNFLRINNAELRGVYFHYYSTAHFTTNGKMNTVEWKTIEDNKKIRLSL